MPDFGVQIGYSAEQLMAQRIVYQSKNKDKSHGKFDEIHSITKNYVERIWLFQKHKCFYCDKQMQVWDRCSENGCTIERLDNKFGHTIKNCVLACRHCNFVKSGGRPKNKPAKLFRKKQGSNIEKTKLFKRNTGMFSSLWRKK